MDMTFRRSRELKEDRGRGEGMKIASLFLVVLIGLLAFCQSGPRKTKADLVLMGGTVWTGEEGLPWAEAVAVKEGEIIGVGSNGEISKLIGRKTQVIDLKKKLLLPGFIDSHTHFLDGGFSLTQVQLQGVNTKGEFIRRIEAKAKELPPGQWILGGNWNHQTLKPPELPQKSWIDPVTPQHPVCVFRHDGHMALVNSRALEMAGITPSTVAPPGGEIVRDKTGEPTGILKDAAINLVARIIPETDFNEKLAAARRALAKARQFGLTSIHDMSGLDAFYTYQELLEQGELTARITVYPPLRLIDSPAELLEAKSQSSPFLKIGGVKGFIDGSLGSATALFFEPYLDRPDSCGLFAEDMFPEGIMEKRLNKADKLGLQVAVHAIGDRANHLILNIFQQIIQKRSPRERRWRIEHAQHLRREDIPRFAQLKVIASVQPYHLVDDGCWAETRIGPARCRTTYAFRSLLQAGVILAAGSDWTVAPLNPLTGIYAAVTRQTADGQYSGGWIPEERISVEEAVRAYTWGGAWAEFSEEKKGTIKPGKYADLVVLDRNIFEIPPERIKETQVNMVIVAGRLVFVNKEGK
jgi:hypothetical protein